MQMRIPYKDQPLGRRAFFVWRPLKLDPRRYQYVPEDTPVILVKARTQLQHMKTLETFQSNTFKCTESESESDMADLDNLQYRLSSDTESESDRESDGSAHIVISEVHTEDHGHQAEKKASDHKGQKLGSLTGKTATLESYLQPKYEKCLTPVE